MGRYRAARLALMTLRASLAPGKNPLSRAPARTPKRRIHPPLPHHRSEGYGPTDAASVSKIRQRRHQVGGDYDKINSIIHWIASHSKIQFDFCAYWRTIAMHEQSTQAPKKNCGLS